MATNNRTTRNASPEPIDPNESLLVSLDELIAVAAANRTNAKATAANAKATAAPVLWTPATVAAAAALPVPVEMPARYPVKGPGSQITPSGFVAAPKDLGALDHTPCPERRNDPLLAVIRAALLNDWHGHALHAGPSAADGGTLPLPVLLTVLATQPAQQKARKWAQILTASGQTCIIAQTANVAGRFVICRPEGITLVRDFYAPAA